MIVEDLDVLRPEPRILRMNGNDIDVSFVPCGITFEIDRIVQELGKMTQDSMLNGEDTKKAFDLAIDLCVAFCSHKYPKMDNEWFRENADAFQIKAFSTSIREALVRAYSGIESTSKNLMATEKE